MVDRAGRLPPVHSLPASRRILLGRLLALLMLVMALLPAASRAWAAGQGDWVELCTAQGTRWVSLSTGEAGEPDFKPLDSPCAACLVQAHGMAPPPAAPVWAPTPLMAERPLAFLHAPRLLPVWRSASSRGPPASL